MLENIRIVLCQTTHPGNIGAAARAMKNMGLARMYLVQPKCFPSAEATALASGASDLLANAVICKDLGEAVGECTLVMGTSARYRSIPIEILPLRRAAAKVLTEASDSQVAIVFGQERSGLTNDEVMRCNMMLHIPCNPEFSSLNLSQSVQLISYEIFQAINDDQIPASRDCEGDIANHAQLESFHGHFSDVVALIAYADPDKARKLMIRIRRLFNRSRPSTNEINIFRGFLSSIEKKLNP